MYALEVHNLKKSYVTPDGGRLCVVEVPQFMLAAGDAVALQGRSGSGKTTFLNLIAGILKADEGHIVVAGQTMSGLTESRRDAVRALHIGYVFQTLNLMQGYSALENVTLGMMFGAGVDLDFARHLLEKVGLAERMHYRPRQLSVGQQQRVALARALANRPKLVLADEPTGNLDPRSAAEALTLLRERCQELGAALLIVSHDREILGLFDHVEALAEINRAGRGVEALTRGAEQGASEGGAS